MRKKIDQDFIEAVRKAVDVLGGQVALAHHSGVTQGTICSLLNPKNDRKFVHSSIYNRLYPFISPYLPEQPEIPIGPGLPPQIPVMPANPFYNNTINNNIASAPIMSGQTVPVNPGVIPAEVLLHAMHGMSPEEKARFLKELYIDCSHETENTSEEE